MVAIGARKAALLLTRLSPETASELLKTADPDLVAQIATELVYIEASGQRPEAFSDEPVREFFGLLSSGQGPVNLDQFTREILAGALGQQQSKEVLGQARRVVQNRDPFAAIRSAQVDEITQALAGESAQVAAVVLSELPTEKSAAVLPRLDEATRTQAIRHMTAGTQVSQRARERVATMMRQRLDALRAAQGGTSQRPEAQLRRAAVLLRSLKTDLRDTLVKAIADQDPDAGTKVQDLMVTWEDVGLLSDHSLQDVLRNTEAGVLALSLSGADAKIIEKIRRNISERARAMIDEETSLMKQPKADDIQAARDELLALLRQMNANGDLTFEEG